MHNEFQTARSERMSASKMPKLCLLLSKRLLFRSNQLIHHVVAIVAISLLPKAPCLCLLVSHSLSTTVQLRTTSLLGSKPSNRNLKTSQVTKRWLAVPEQRAQLPGPLQSLFSRMSTVSTLRFRKSQTKILTFNEILVVHSWTKSLSVSSLSCRKEYIDLTENSSDFVHRHLNMSLLFNRWVPERVSVKLRIIPSSSVELGVKPDRILLHLEPLPPKPSFTR